MKIKCPYCGSEELHEHYDTTGGSDEEIRQLYVCLDCDGDFALVYKFAGIEKES